MRKNSILKVAIEKNAKVTLTSSSTFYPIFYEDIEELINQKLKGIYHITTEKLVSLKEISKEYATNPEWGSHTYESPYIDINCKRFLSKEMSFMNPLDRLKEFIEDNGWEPS